MRLLSTPHSPASCAALTVGAVFTEAVDNIVARIVLIIAAMRAACSSMSASDWRLIGAVTARSGSVPVGFFVSMAQGPHHSGDTRLCGGQPENRCNLLLSLDVPSDARPAAGFSGLGLSCTSRRSGSFKKGLST